VSGTPLDEGLAGRIKQKISDDLSRRHVPDFVVQVRSIPRTLNGKRMEVPVKRIFEGGEVDAALHRGSMADPSSIEEYVELAKKYRKDGKL
jgi:acetoacetyl-CoA synthetase